MSRPNTTIKKFLKAISPDDARSVAEIAKTSVPHLRHIAAGRRNMSCDLAWAISKASGTHFGFRSQFFLPQPSLCEACGKNHAK